mgnify:CR=1 FL=1
MIPPVLSNIHINSSSCLPFLTLPVLSDSAAIFPITPSSPLAEHYDTWVSKKRDNLFGGVCDVRQLQSEAGAAGKTGIIRMIT